MTAIDPTRPASDPALITAAAFNAAAAAAAMAATPGSFLNDALSQFAALLDVPACSILVQSEEGLKCAAAVGLGASYLDGPGWDLLPEGFHSRWTVPLALADGRTLGELVAYRDVPGDPQAETLELALAYASVLALGLDRIRQQSVQAARYQAVVVALTSALDARDEYTGRHASDTADLANQVARKLGVDAARREVVAQVAVMHDIGKLGIPTEVLLKDGSLDPDELAVVRQHPVIGERILSAIPGLVDVALAIRHEHERWDGHGYPDGLAGEQIPLASRIVFACDSWHAMTSNRPYRLALDPTTALCELREGAGRQFDPRVAQALLEVLGDGSPPVACSPAEPPEVGLHRELFALATELGADDVLVFRRVADGVYSHLGGVGRGAGWAGNIELDSREERHLHAALASGTATCVELDRVGRIVGPYYARTAVIIPCDDDSVVIFGSSTDAVSGICTEKATTLAEHARRLVVSVSPAKRLADELEVLTAVREVTTIDAETMAGTLTAIAHRARAALSIEFAAAATIPDPGQEPIIGVSVGRWAPRDGEATAAALARFAGRVDELPFLCQDVAQLGDPPAGFAQGDGVSSLHVLPIGSPTVGVLLAVHAEPGLRGFTDLCRRVASAMSEAAEPIVRRAIAQTELRAENERLAERVRTDALTGVASRSAWDEMLRGYARDPSSAPGPMAVAIVDVDGLKVVNDELGHAAGDAVLRHCARVLADTVGRRDMVARIGGDEFGVLLHNTDSERAQAWCERVTSLLYEFEGRRLRWSVGSASVPPCPGITTAVDEADRQMYAQKVRRRGSRA